MIRLTLAIVAGVVAAFLGVMATDFAMHGAATASGATPPSTSEPAALGEYVASLPVAVLAIFVVGCFVSALVGSGLAARLGRRAWAGWLVAGLLLAATVANFVMVPNHPLWMMVGSILAILIGGWLGPRVLARGRLARA